MIYNIKAVCRDGGAVERARFEIVLCRNVYKGSNPFLCATEKGRLVPSFFRGILRNILQSLVFSFKVCYNIIKYYNDGFIENEMYFYL